MIKTHSKLVQRTAHYYTYGNLSAQTKYCWILCHGYGQQAERIIRKFEDFDEAAHFVIAPEGLSRFYWNNLTGQVGASWMTKKDRLDEIADYTRYIKSIYDEYIPQCAEDVKIILMGFSQGCATQLRWIMREFPVYHHLVLWAGLLPEDLDYTPYRDYFQSKKMHFIYGNEDQFLNEERINWHRDFAKAQALNMEAQEFEGKHKIDRKVLRSFFEQKIKGLSN